MTGMQELLDADADLTDLTNQGMVRYFRSVAAAMIISINLFNPSYPEKEAYEDQTYNAGGNFVADEEGILITTTCALASAPPTPGTTVAPMELTSMPTTKSLTPPAEDQPATTAASTPTTTGDDGAKTQPQLSSVSSFGSAALPLSLLAALASGVVGFHLWA
uniref:Uncharacterized protein n=1 Tax=Odontella aurita TaxID=265563 RepID=A0A7S4M5F3_9STRA|mmetsp:Transcript_11075/g.32855  ORF Transcript_11075/g.32855 Transcript_11075/m.32855 type:complete len:162 (+) Transcript_11075:950-1435(+)